MFPNRYPEELAQELSLARRLGIVPLRPGDPGFADLVTDGTVKWVLTLADELLFIPKSVGSAELAHPIMTGGAPVQAAGEAEIIALDGEYGLLDITRHSGHYHPDSQSLRIARQAFAVAGIRPLPRRK